MVYMILSLIIVFLIIKTIIYYGNACALLYLINKKGYDLPTENELKSTTDWVIKNTINDIFFKD